MRKQHLEICLFQPEIPQNTGNIARLAAATQCRLHLISPFGFAVNDKQLRRPGLDYWPYLDLEVHADLRSLLERFAPEEIAFLSTKGQTLYTQIQPQVRLIVFGRETSGLPEWVYAHHADRLYHIPIYHPSVRSLNVANSVSIITYHMLSQNDRGCVP